MSYLVLARKYRPQTFDEVVGQKHVTTTLANAFAMDRVHHAFLFCGPRGCGKTTTARVLGKALNCEQGPTAEPCGECVACRSIGDGSAIDYHEMDGASNRGIDAIRELTDAVRYQPASLRKKVYVIDEVHMLTTEAFNALLKTLEEPPPHVTFVLATTEPHKIPNTILSRCQRFDFKLVPRADLTAHLEGIFNREEIDVEPGAVALLIRESGGSVRDALSLSDQIISFVGSQKVTEEVVAEILGVADRALTRSLVGALAAGDAGTALDAAESAASRGVDEVQIARAIVRHLRDLAVVQVAPESDRLVDGSAEERAELLEQSKSIPRWRIKQMFERMLRACQDLAQNQQPRLILDLALIDVSSQEPQVPVGDLINKLAALEARLGSGPAGGNGSGGGGGGARRANPKEAASVFAEAASKLSSAPAENSRAGSASSTTTAPAQTAASMPASSTAAASAQTAAAMLETPRQEAPPNVPIEQVPLGGPERPDVARPNDAAASPAVASASGGRTIGPDPLAEWEKTMSALDRAKQISLITVYQTAKVLRFAEDGVEVGFPEGGLTSEIAASPEKVTAMRDFLRDELGRSVDFKVSLLSPEEEAKAVSILEDAERRAREDREQRRQEAENHPTTRLILETFGATIKEIKTDV